MLIKNTLDALPPPETLEAGRFGCQCHDEFIQRELSVMVGIGLCEDFLRLLLAQRCALLLERHAQLVHVHIARIIGVDGLKDVAELHDLRLREHEFRGPSLLPRVYRAGRPSMQLDSQESNHNDEH